MVSRWFLLPVFFFAYGWISSTAAAQSRVPKAQLEYIDTQLKDAETKLANGIVAFKKNASETDDGGDWRRSQVAWEQSDQRFGFPPADVEEALALNAAQRSPRQLELIETFFLASVNDQSKIGLQPLYERYQWLKSHQLGGVLGVSDDYLKNAKVTFWKRRLVDSYRVTTSDEVGKQKLVIEFLEYAAENIATHAGLDNVADSLSRKCVKAGCDDPIFLTLSYHVRSMHNQKRFPHASKTYPAVVQQLKTSKYPPTILALARLAQWHIKKVTNEKDPATDGEFEQLTLDFGDSLISSLASESHCSENVEALENVLRMFYLGYPQAGHWIALYNQILASDLQEGFKQRMLQVISGRIGGQPSAERSTREKFAAKAIEHGQAAVSELPLLAQPIAQLMSDLSLASQTESIDKYFRDGIRRAPRHYLLYRNYLFGVMRNAEVEQQIRFVLDLLKSNDFEAGLPWIGIYLIEDCHRESWNGSGLEVHKNKTVLKAMEDLLYKTPAKGKSLAWCKRYKQFVNHLMMQAGFFKEALRVAKDLEGDFGPYDYKGQKLTVARIAKLCHPVVREVQESIDAGTFDLSKIEQTIDGVTLARMEMGGDEGVYIDEMIDLLTAVEAFESGEWADLTPPTVYLSNWKTLNDFDKWSAASKAIQTSMSNSSLVRDIAWRWPINGAYVIEADIQLDEYEKSAEKKSGFVGFVAGTGKTLAASVPTDVSVQFSPYWQEFMIDGPGKRKFKVKELIHQEGSNLLRMRVWKDYFEFTINGRRVGQYVVPSAFPGHVVLKKSYGVSRALFRNVRVRKLDLPSPIADNRLDVDYWKGRLEREPKADDVRKSLENAQQAVRQKQQSADVERQPTTSREPTKQKPLNVKDGLVARWSFDDDLRESVSNQPLVGHFQPKLVDVKGGRGLLLSDGSSSNLIAAQGSPPLNLNQPFTVTFWTRWQSDDGVFIAQAGEDTSFMVYTSSGRFCASLRHPDCFISTRMRNIKRNRWRHMAVTFDGKLTEKSLGIFTNKTRETKTRHSEEIPQGKQFPKIDSLKTQLFFGCNPFRNRKLLGNEAIIDDLRFYNRVLSPEEVEQVLNYDSKW